MKYETPELTALTPAINAVQTDDPSGIKDQPDHATMTPKNTSLPSLTGSN